MLDLETIKDLQKRVLELKKIKNAYIIAHNYQLPEIQDVADYVGDSLGMALEAKKTNHPIVVVCGVHFMAETAAILLPDRKVLIPDPMAGCSLADSITVEQLKEWKAKYPNAVVVSYINTTAEVKALSDYCCTSSNAVEVVRSIPEDKDILFLPDMYLGMYVKEVTKRDNIYIWPGECHVHAKVKISDIVDAIEKNPDADLLVHPECGCTSNCLYMKEKKKLDLYVLSTGGMVRHIKNSQKQKFIVATETGIIHRLKKENLDKEIKPLREDMVCEYMKMITIDKLVRSLEEEIYEVKVPPEIAEKARKAVERMLQITP
ncbi:MAG: quinolinate synthase NadA [Candidatus Caldipriscus sp.]|jgi:quinolinate synthase